MKRKRVLVYLIMIGAIMVSINLIRDILRLKSADTRIAEAEKELIEAKKENMELKRQLEEVKTAEWRERQIRNVLKMAKPNEVVAIVPESVKKNKERVNNSNQMEEESPLRQWWRLLTE